MESRIYFNATWDPETIYRLLKPLCVIYDQVIVWSPRIDDLEQAGWSVNEFLSACEQRTDGMPVIIPAGRSTFYDPEARRSNPTISRRQFSPAFDGRLLECAQRASKELGFSPILGLADYEHSHVAINQLWSDERRRSEMRASFDRLSPQLSSDFLDRVVRVAEDERIHSGGDPAVGPSQLLCTGPGSLLTIGKDTSPRPASLCRGVAAVRASQRRGFR